MRLTISPKKTIKELQAEFHAQYPYLKLEFFRKSHQAGMPSPKADLIASNNIIGTLMNGFPPGEVSIEGSRTVASLEEEFRLKYGLNIQVFRKSQNLWIETSLTDHWTLERQNEEGRAISLPHQEPDKLDLGDRDKWE